MSLKQKITINKVININEYVRTNDIIDYHKILIKI